MGAAPQRLAVGDDLFVGRDPQLVQHGLDLGCGFEHLHIRVLQPGLPVGVDGVDGVAAGEGLQPHQVHRAGNVVATGSQLHFAGILLRRAGVHQDHVGIVGGVPTYARPHLIGGGQLGVVQAQRVLGWLHLGDLIGGRQPLGYPGIPAAIEHADVLMAHEFQRPEEPAGVHHAQVVVDDGRHGGGEAGLVQRGLHFLPIEFKRNIVDGRGDGVDGDVDRARHVGFSVRFGRADVEDANVRVIEVVSQPGGVHQEPTVGVLGCQSRLRRR